MNRNTMSGVRMAGPKNPGMGRGQRTPQMSQDQAAIMAMSSVQGTSQLSSGIQSQASIGRATPMSQSGQNMGGLQPGVNQMGGANPNMGGANPNMPGNRNMQGMGGVNTSVGGTNPGMGGPSQSMSGTDPSMSSAQLGGQPAPQVPPLPGPWQQPTSQLQNRNIIWRGQLEWQDKKQAATVMPGPHNRITRTLGCMVSITATDQEILTTSWPATLIMQLMPQTLLSTNWLNPLFKNSRQVAFHFENNNNLKNLYKWMDNGFAGCVHFPSNLPCDIRVLLLLFSNKRKSFVGLIPNDQRGVVSGIHHVITQHKQRFQQNPNNPMAGTAGPAGPGGMPRMDQPNIGMGPAGAQPPAGQTFPKPAELTGTQVVPGGNEAKSSTPVKAENQPPRSSAAGLANQVSGKPKDRDKVLMELEKLRDMKLCKICLENELSITFVPCGHLSTCEDCARNLTACPICRNPISQAMKVYWS